MIRLVVTHRGATHELELPSTSTTESLRQELAALTSVPPPNQKLVVRGKQLVAGALSAQVVGTRPALKGALHD